MNELIEGYIRVGNDASLFYTDSGPPVKSEDYTTVMMVHGTAFNGHIFRKLAPLAGSSNARLVAINRRGYHGSTPFSELELEILRDGRKEFLQDRALELSQFILRFIEENRLPEITINETGLKKGGVVVVGWSAGNAITTGLLGQSLPAEVTTKLQLFVRTLVVYDPPYFSLAYDGPPDVDLNAALPELDSSPESVARLSRFVSTHYTHPNLSSRSMDGLVMTGGRDSTTDSMTAQDLERGLDGSQLLVSELPMIKALHDELKLQRDRALYDISEAPSTLAEVNVVTIWCRQSPWIFPWAAFESRRIYEERVSRGAQVRLNNFISVDGNHYVHWEKPDLLWGALHSAVGW